MINNSGTPCIYSKKETPKPIDYERSEDWLKRKDQSRNNKGQFTSPTKSANKDGYLNLSIISVDEFECYSKSYGKPVHTNIDNELRLLLKDINLTSEQGIHNRKNKTLNRHNWSENLIDYLSQNKPKN